MACDTLGYVVLLREGVATNENEYYNKKDCPIKTRAPFWRNWNRGFIVLDAVYALFNISAHKTVGTIFFAACLMSMLFMNKKEFGQYW